MGLWATIFGKRPDKPSSDEMKLLTAYAQLVEQLGAERIVEGVEIAQLPAGKDELKDIIARVSLSPWTGFVLEGDDLAKLYGLTAFFFTDEDLALFRAARDLDPRIAACEVVSVDDLERYNRGMGLMTAGFKSVSNAAEALKVHAASLR